MGELQHRYRTIFRLHAVDGKRMATLRLAYFGGYLLDQIYPLERMEAL